MSAGGVSAGEPPNAGTPGPTGELRLRRLEDIEEIRNLKIRYAELCDEGFDPESLVGLFTEDGVWDCGEFGVFRGPDEMAGYWRQTAAVTRFSHHYMTNHVVDLEPGGAEASGRCYMLGTATREGVAYWMAVRYVERYRRTEAGWRFSLMQLHPSFMTPYELSWAASMAASDS